MPRKDPKERAEYHRKYVANKIATDPAYKAKHYARVARNNAKCVGRQTQMVEWFRRGGCQVCGEPSAACLDSHHIDPASKEFTIGAVRRGCTMSHDRFEKELTKCLCLCKNCHAKFHAGVLALPELQSPMLGYERPSES